MLFTLKDLDDDIEDEDDYDTESEKRTINKRMINIVDKQIYKSILNKLNAFPCLFLSTELAE